ncbi:HDIG domain-containing protein [Desulfovibrio sp. OttesenSCG-928-I05]|nr:HDIG domain-containing protein [Desulfovibrio sp. OttesenSCG-928-I05]
MQGLPYLIFERDPSWHVPDRAECTALWDRFEMPDHIRAHSDLVAGMAEAIARKLHEHGAAVHVPSVLAAGLLHDLGKMYSINHGGSHAQIGAAWVMSATRNPHIAQGVMQHVDWMWEVDADDDRQLHCLCVMYADKRVKHDVMAGLTERYADIMDRYGITPEARERIAFARNQAQEIEAALSRRIGVELNEHTFDSGRLVKRA